MGDTRDKSVGESLRLAVEKCERSVDAPSPERTLYNNEGKWWESGIVRCFILVASPN